MKIRLFGSSEPIVSDDGLARRERDGRHQKRGDDSHRHDRHQPEYRRRRPPRATSTSIPPGAHTTTGGPGAAAESSSAIAIAMTEQPAHTAQASAPHLVLPRQNSAATSKARAPRSRRTRTGSPARRYCGAFSAMKYATPSPARQTSSRSAPAPPRRIAPCPVEREHVLREHRRERQNLRVARHHRGHDARAEQAREPYRRIGFDRRSITSSALIAPPSRPAWPATASRPWSPVSCRASSFAGSLDCPSRGWPPRRENAGQPDRHHAQRIEDHRLLELGHFCAVRQKMLMCGKAMAESGMNV